jgi:hypothetical protein
MHEYSFRWNSIVVVVVDVAENLFANQRMHDHNNLLTIQHFSHVEHRAYTNQKD